MQLSLAAATLRRHPARTLLATIGVAVSAAMLLDMVMLASGMRESFRELLSGQGFSVRVAPRGTIPFDTEATIPDATAAGETIRAIPGVTTVAPALGGALHVTVGDSTVSAFGLGLVPAIQGDYELGEGRDIAAADHLVVSASFLRATGARLGDTLDVAVGYDPQLRRYAGRRRLVVVGRGRFFYLASEQPAAALRLGTLQAMAGGEQRDRVSIFMLKTAPGIEPDSVRDRVNAAVRTVSALSTADAIATAEQRLSYFRQLAFILGAVSLVVGFLLVTTLVTVSVNERIGEIAVLRAMGVSRAHVVQQVVLESLAMSAGGALAGLGLGLVTARWLETILGTFPGLPDAIAFFRFDPLDAWSALGMLVASGAAAAVYPSWRASRLPIAETLRAEAVG